MNNKEQVLGFNFDRCTIDQLIELELPGINKHPIESQKERVLRLGRNGYPAKKIAELSGIPIRSVYRHMSDCNNIEKKLTVKNYINAVKNGYDTKDDLLKQFKVSKKTLLQFEKESGVLILLANAKHIQGKSDKEIGAELHLRLGTIDNFNIHQSPTIQQIKNGLSQILAIYEKMAEVDNSYVAKFSTIKSIIQKL